MKKCSYWDVFSQKTVYHKQGTFSMLKCKIASIYAAFWGILALSFHVFLYQFVVTDFCPRLLGKIDNSRVLRLLIINLFYFFGPYLPMSNKMSNRIVVFCKHFLDIVACPFWTMLQRSLDSHLTGYRIPLQTLCNCYSKAF